MKQHTADELKSMNIEDITSYYEKMHSLYATKEINPIFL
jgi:hypothetical protein